MAKAVFCIARSETVAKDIVEKLKTMGFSAADVSVLFPDQTGTRDFAYEQHTKAPEGATAGGIVGAGAGGLLGWLAGLGTVQENIAGPPGRTDGPLLGWAATRALTQPESELLEQVARFAAAPLTALALRSTLATLLEEFYRSGDRQRLFYAKIDVGGEK